MRLSIGKKLGLTIGGLLSMFVLIGGLAIHEARIVQESIEIYAQEKDPLLEASYLMDIDLLGTSYWLAAHLYDQNNDHLKQMVHFDKLFAEHLSIYEAKEKNPEGIHLARKVGRAREELSELAQKLIKAEKRQRELLADISKSLSIFESLIEKKLQNAISPQAPQAVEWTHQTMKSVALANAIGGRIGIYLKTHEQVYADDAHKEAAALIRAVDRLETIKDAAVRQNQPRADEFHRLRQIALTAQSNLTEIVSLEYIKHELILASESLVRSTGDILNNGLQVMAKQGVDQAMERVKATSRNVTSTVIYTVIIALLFGITFGIVMSFNLSRPLHQLVKATQHVAEGEFSVPIPIQRGDEIGELGSALAKMARSLGEYNTARDRSEAKFRTMLELAVSGIIMIDTQGIIQMANPAAERMFGYDKSELVGHDVRMLMPKHDAEHHQEYINNYISTGVNRTMGTSLEVWGKHRNGTLIPLELAVSEIKLEDEHLFLGLLADKSERKQYEEQLKLLAGVFNHTIEGIFITDRKGRIERVNPGFTRITGYSAEEAIGRTPRLLKSDRHGPEFYKQMWQSIRETGTWEGEIWNRKKNGEVFPEWQSITSIRDDHLNVTHYVAVFHDISNIKASQKKLQYQANHDALTDLPNRHLFIDRLSQAVASARRSGDRLAVLFLDLDKFKDINDTLGHQVGDQVLITVAQRLKACCRDEDTVARLGGDEFMILLPRQTDVHNVAAVAERINRALIEPMELNGQMVYPGASVGISLYPDDGEDAATLMKNSDMAMYRSKAGGRNTYSLFTASMNEELSRRTALEADLRHAMERDEFEALFQPIISTNSLKILGVEALMRWHRRKEELVSPVEFIPLAEDFGLIHDMGLWMIETACRQAQQFNDAGFEQLSISVNLSRVQLQNKDLTVAVEQIIKDTGFNPRRLRLEITENIVMHDMEKAVAAMDRFREMGIDMVMDDFGTGYSSLGQLKEMPLRTIKIDKSFIRDCPQDERSTALVEAAVAMGKRLGLEVVAEGVETADQLAMLRKFGCDALQGFLFAKPKSADDLMTVLQSNQGCFGGKENPPRSEAGSNGRR